MTTYTPDPQDIHVAEAAPPKRDNKKLFIILGVVGAVLCLCSVICLAGGGFAMYNVVQEQPKVAAVVDEFMRHMDNGNTDQAYTLFSERSKRQTPQSALDAMLEGNTALLFEGYQSSEVTNLNISANFNTDDDLPQGQVATVNGIVKYADGIDGTFDAVLEKDGEQWYLHRIDINAPAEKFGG